MTRKLKWVGKLYAFTEPTPLDAWLLSSLVFWGLALFGSVVWFRNFEPVYSYVPLAPIAVSILAGLFAFGCAASLRVGASLPGRSRWSLLSRFHPAVLFRAMLRGIRSRSTEQWVVSLLVAIGVFWILKESMGDPLPAALRKDFFMVDSGNGWAVLINKMKAYWMTAAVVLAFAGGWVLIGMGDALIKAGRYCMSHRLVCMLAFLAVGFPAVILRNIFDPGHLVSGNILSTLFVVGAALLGLMVLLAVVWVWSGERWFRLKFAVASILGLAGTAAMTVFYFEVAFDWFFLRRSNWVALLAAIALLWLPLLVMAQQPNPKTENGRTRRFSTASLVMFVSAAVGLTLATNTYDLRILSMMDVKMRQLEPARLSKSLSRSSGGAIRLIPSPFSKRMAFFALVRIRGREDEECLTALSDAPIPYAAVVIENIQPFVDTVPLRGQADSFMIYGGELTSTQLSDLSKQSVSLSFVNVDLPAERLEGVSLPPCSWSSDGTALGLAGFLDHYVTESKAFSRFSIRSKLSLDEWQAVVRANQKTEFTIAKESVPDSAFDLTQSPSTLSPPASLKHIRLQFEQQTIPDDRVLKFLLETDIQVAHNLPLLPDHPWDWVFAKPGLFMAPDFAKDLSADGILELLNDRNFAYHWDKQGNVTHLWLPNLQAAKEYLTQLKTVRTLRLDNQRLFDSSDWSYAWNLDVLSRLPNLRELYLDDVSFAMDLTFLASLPKLKHLQISGPSRYAQSSSGFDACPSLETIRFFGQPTTLTIAELRKLPALREVVVVDDDGFLSTPAEIATLVAALPGISVRVIESQNYEPDVSDHFRKHRQAIRQRVLDRVNKRLAQPTPPNKSKAKMSE